MPRPQAVVTGQGFFFYALTCGALAFAATHLVSLLHGVIDLAFDD